MVFVALFAAMAVTVVAADGREMPGKADWMLQTNLLERATEARQGLPNVLLLGDSISMGYTPRVRDQLAGRANVTRPRCNCGPSQFYLREKNGMRDWTAAQRKWDAIVVGFCCWDYCYMKGKSDEVGQYWDHSQLSDIPPLQKGTAIRDRGYRVRTPILEYMENTHRILAFLKEKSDCVIFALGTPATAYTDDRCGLARVYNEVAAQVCREMGVRTVDLYSVAERHYDKLKDGVHFTREGSDLLAKAIVEQLEKSSIRGLCP